MEWLFSLDPAPSFKQGRKMMPSESRKILYRTMWSEAEEIQEVERQHLDIDGEAKMQREAQAEIFKLANEMKRQGKSPREIMVAMARIVINLRIARCPKWAAAHAVLREPDRSDSVGA